MNQDYLVDDLQSTHTYDKMSRWHDDYDILPMQSNQMLPQGNSPKQLSSWFGAFAIGTALSLSGLSPNPREIESLRNSAMRQGAPLFRVFSRRLTMREALELAAVIQREIDEAILHDQAARIRFWFDQDLL